MNSITVRALFADALAQVLDNRVFRLLTGLVFLLVLPTFLVGAREDSLVIAFGWREYFYQDVFHFLELPYPGIGQAHITLIQAFQQVFVDYFAGTIGILFCIAATAFFVPSMLEKGSADTIFSKPISRFTLLMSRYVAGLIFISILSVVLVGGMHLGFMVSSGYSDPGFLWSIPTLIYIYGMVHSFSVLIGAWSRSTVVAILTSILFFLFSGCVHTGWKAKERNRERVEEVQSGNMDAVDAETFDKLLKAAMFTLNTLHYTLPKTTDAPLIAQKLRSQFDDSGVPYSDAETGLAILTRPEGFEQTEVEASELPEGSSASLTWTSGEGENQAKIHFDHLRFTERSTEEDKLNRHDLARHMAGEVAEERRLELEADRSVQQLSAHRSRRGIWRNPRTGWDSDGKLFAKRSSAQIRWERADREHELVFFGTAPDSVFSVEFDLPVGWTEDAEENQRSLTGFRESFTYLDQDDNELGWYEERFDWKAEWKYNIYFSIGSSLLFVLIVLLLARWRVRRIDF